MKIRPVGVDLFHANGQTDRKTDRHNEANSRFLENCERAQKCVLYLQTMPYVIFRRKDY